MSTINRVIALCLVVLAPPQPRSMLRSGLSAVVRSLDHVHTKRRRYHITSTSLRRSCRGCGGSPCNVRWFRPSPEACRCCACLRGPAGRELQAFRQLTSLGFPGAHSPTVIEMTFRGHRALQTRRLAIGLPVRVYGRASARCSYEPMQLASTQIPD